MDLERILLCEEVAEKFIRDLANSDFTEQIELLNKSILGDKETLDKILSVISDGLSKFSLPESCRQPTWYCASCNSVRTKYGSLCEHCKSKSAQNTVNQTKGIGISEISNE